MNESDKELLELIKQLPELQAFGLTKDGLAIEISPVNTKDLSPARINELLVNMRKLFKLAKLSTTDSE